MRNLPNIRNYHAWTLIGWILALSTTILLAFTLQERRIQNQYDRKLSDFVSNINSSLCKYMVNRPNGICIAVKELSSADSSEKALSQIISEDVAFELLNNSCNIQICDRSEFISTLRELKMSEEKLTDTAHKISLGKLSSINVLLTGHVIVNNSLVRVSIKIIDLEKGILIAASSVTLPENETIKSFKRRTIVENGEIKLTEKIKAESTLSKWFSDFFVTNWSWLWTVVMLPIYAWTVKKFRTKD